MTAFFVPIIRGGWPETLSYVGITLGGFVLSIRILRAIPPEPPLRALRRISEK